MASEELDLERVAELRGFLQAFAKLHQALSIGRFDFDARVLPVEDGVEDTLQRHFDSLGQKLRPPVKHWEMKVEKLDPWQQQVEETLRRWFLIDEGFKDFYEDRRARDPRPGEFHVGTNDIARSFREQLETILGKGRKRVLDVSVHALIGASDRYMATLDNHLAFELDDSILLLSFCMSR